MTDDAFHLTALDARRYDFGNALRGYDRARVDQFRDQVAEELERLSRANQELEVKARNFHEQLRAFRERDKALNDALISAQQLRGEIREQAQREAQLIIREAQGDAERSLEILRGEIRRAEDDLQNLWRNRRSYVQQLRQLMERQLHDLDSADMVPPPTGIALPVADTRESSRADLSRSDASRADAPREMSAPVVREFQTPREVPASPVTREPVSAPPVREAVPRDTAPRDIAPRDVAPVAPRNPTIPQPFVEAPRVVKQPWASPEAQPSQPAPMPPVQIPPHAPLQHTQTFATPTRELPPISPQAAPPLQRPSIPTPSWLDVVEGEGE